ncbi:nucleotide sugar dehydrogenase [bacterium]|nr:MAG: nucleotide sugar dehydrogenase [bacterium]
MRQNADLCVIGGAGHVGLPLALAFADRGLRVRVVDVNRRALAAIAKGRMPFMEEGGAALLRRVLKSGRLELTDKASGIRGARFVVLTIGTPIDEFLNPRTGDIEAALKPLLPHLGGRQTLVLRSTVTPGVTEWVGRFLRGKGVKAGVAFAPERIVQGRAVEELGKLPQIVSGTTRAAEDEAAALFGHLAPRIVRLAPREAEFAKLFCNAYRYIQFAAANQFYMIANSAGLDYSRIHRGMKEGYDRLRDLPGAGFAAGPCLFKDTMQLAASPDHDFNLGHAAMRANERLPVYIVRRLSQRHDLAKKTVGLLGMAFKADNDDPRSSLSYKLKKLLALRAKAVLTTDPFVRDPALRPLAEVVRKSDILILCAPHTAYKGLDTRGKVVADVWGFFGRGNRV